MNLLLFFILILTVIVNAVPQVPYDYIPIGRAARRDNEKAYAPHPSDINLNYERLFPSRRKWSD